MRLKEIYGKTYWKQQAFYWSIITPLMVPAALLLHGWIYWPTAAAIIGTGLWADGPLQRRFWPDPKPPEVQDRAKAIWS